MKAQIEATGIHTENGLREFKLQRCMRKENDREDWASVIKQAKILGGTYSQGVVVWRVFHWRRP
jgi:hypothetical protein